MLKVWRRCGLGWLTGGMVLLGLAACPPSTGSDAGSGDAGGGIECHPNLPEPSDPCLAGQCGNEQGVGQQCTPGGGECSDFAVLEDGTVGAIFCTADFNPTNLWYCTKPCVVDEDCGPGPYNCEIDEDDPGAGSGCFVTACYEADPPDAGNPDAGQQPAPDAGAGGDGGS